MGVHNLLLCPVEGHREAGNPGSAPKELTDGLGRQDPSREVSTRLMAM